MLIVYVIMKIRSSIHGQVKWFDFNVGNGNIGGKTNLLVLDDLIVSMQQHSILHLLDENEPRLGWKIRMYPRYWTSCWNKQLVGSIGTEGEIQWIWHFIEIYQPAGREYVVSIKYSSSQKEYSHSRKLMSACTVDLIKPIFCQMSKLDLSV